MGKKQEVKKPLTLKEKLKEKQEQKEANRKNAKLERGVSILRSLLVYPDDVRDFGGIDNAFVITELTTLRATYPIDKLKFLIISIIDIIHDAHGSRVGATTQVAHLSLFKIVVCNIFGITETLYDYIYNKVVPVTQNVLQKFIEDSVPEVSSLTAQAYFTQKSREQISLGRVQPLQGGPPLSVTNILRDNVGIGTTLRQHIELLGFQIVYAKTPSIVLDSVSVPMTEGYDSLNTNISASPRHSVVNELFPGTVNIRVSGNNIINYTATIEYIPPVAAAAAAFRVTFPWNPNLELNPKVGYNPIVCTHIPPTITLNPTTCLPPNNTKNCAFSTAYSYVVDKTDAETIVEYITRANTLLRRTLTTAAERARIEYFQPLTLEQYILCKLIGDYSYCLYYTHGDLNFVTTSDIISGLRLFEKGIPVLFSMGSQMVVYYNRMNYNAPLVIPNLPRRLNITAQKQKEVKEKAKQQLQTKVKGKINNPGKTTNLRQKIPKKAQILRNIRRIGVMKLREQPRVNYFGKGGTIQKGGQTESSLFEKTLTEYADTDWFNKEPSELIKPVNNSPISDENLKLLVEVLKTQFKKFDDQLKELEKDESTFFMSANSSINYRSLCDEIIAYLKNIIDIMSSPECIQAFTESCKQKSYNECIKIMSSYVIMFPFIFDTERWYLNYSYPFSVCFNEYILSLLNLSGGESKYPEIFKFVTNLKTSSSDSPSTPLEYGKKMSFNTAVTFVIMSKCIKTGTQQQFLEQYELYNKQSSIPLTKFDDKSLSEFVLKYKVESYDYDTSADADDADDADYEDIGVDKEYIKSLNSFFEDFVVDNNILYEDFVKKLVSFLIPNDVIIEKGVFSVIKFILLFQNFDNIALCSYTVVKTIIESLLTHKYSSKSFAAINNEFNMLFYYNNLDNFFKNTPDIVTKIKETRDEQKLTSIDKLSILEQNISIQIDLYSYCLDYALSNFYDELYDDKIDSELTFETTDEYVNFQMEKLQKCIDTQVDKYLSYDKELEQSDKTMLDTERLHALGLNKINEREQLRENTALPAGMGGGKNNRISNPKHNTKYRKNYKKFVSKYIINKKKNNNKNNKNNNKKNNKNNKNNKNKKKNNKNKTKKNKRITKSKPNSKRNNKTLKNKKGKSKSNNHKSNYNKKTKTNYYNYYRHNKTLKH